MKNKTNRKIRGFTIPELMLTIAVAAVLLMIGIPQMTKLIEGRQLVGQATEVASALSYARAEAVARSHQVVICSSSDRTTCSNNTNWTTGWIVFADEDNDGVLDSGEEVLKSEGAMNTGVTLNADADLLEFNYLGESEAGADVVFDLCSADPANTGLDVNKSRKITVNRVGSSSITMGDASCSS